MQSPQSTQIPSDKAQLKIIKEKREDFLKKDLQIKLKKFGMGTLFGWDDGTSLKVDIALGVNRVECLLDALHKATEHFENCYGKGKNGIKEEHSRRGDDGAAGNSDRQ